MDAEIAAMLRRWAEQYNTKEFIKDDPIRFPHRFVRKQDIEISAFLTAWISYGRRNHILAKAEELHRLMNGQPYEFIWNASESFKEIQEKSAQTGSRNTFYRFYTYSDLLAICERLHRIYAEYDSLEDALGSLPPTLSPIRKVQQLFSGLNGIPDMSGSSACKRLAMFLRWLVRRDGIVDLGIWQRTITPADLMIPLDTHVFQISCRLGLTQRKTATWKAATEITENLKFVFPEDPCLGDFALFGYDISQNNR